MIQNPKDPSGQKPPSTNPAAHTGKLPPRAKSSRVGRKTGNNQTINRLTSHPRTSHPCGDATTAGEGPQNQGPCPALGAPEQGGTLTAPRGPGPPRMTAQTIEIFFVKLMRKSYVKWA